MTQRLRHAAFHLALAAMLLRALLPAGWMPNPVGGQDSLFVICTLDGPVQSSGDRQPGRHAPDDGQHSHDECPFAAAPHVAAPAMVAALAPPSYADRIFDPTGPAASAVRFSAYPPQSPRAPPLSA